jgi:hypothetical protein
MDDIGNNIDKNGGRTILDRENAIAFLGLAGYNNPEKEIEMVDASAGLINIKGKALVRVRHITFEELWKDLKQVIEIKECFARDKNDEIKSSILNEILELMNNIKEEKRDFDEILNQ